MKGRGRRRGRRVVQFHDAPGATAGPYLPVPGAFPESYHSIHTISPFAFNNKLSSPLHHTPLYMHIWMARRPSGDAAHVTRNSGQWNALAVHLFLLLLSSSSPFIPRSSLSIVTPPPPPTLTGRTHSHPHSQQHRLSSSQIPVIRMQPLEYERRRIGRDPVPIWTGEHTVRRAVGRESLCPSPHVCPAPVWRASLVKALYAGRAGGRGLTPRSAQLAYRPPGILVLPWCDRRTRAT